MATEVLIPKLGMTMTEGTVAEWRVPDGASVQAGEIVFHLETEKIEFEVEAETAGIVRHVVPAGSTLPPGAIVGYILAPGEALPASVPAAADVGVISSGPASATAATTVPAIGEGGRTLASPAARRVAAELGVNLGNVRGTGPGGRIIETDVTAAKQSPAPVAASESSARIAASPIARGLAEQLGIDLGRVTGTGPGGRVTKEDVEAAAAAPPPVPATPAREAGQVIPMRGMRKVIAERMHGSLQQMAQLTMAMEVEMDEAVKLRTALVAEWEPEGIRPGYTDLVIKAVAKALRLHPRLNSTVTANGIELLPDIHVGMAVAVEDGLLVPVIRDADRAPLRDIASESTRLATLAREGKLGPDDMAGGTFSVTTLGMSGVDFFTPVINPPNTAILGVGRIHDALRWDGERPLRCSQMTLSLTIDHRAVDGAPGAAFLQTVRDLLQSPYRLLI
ncbi:MAG: 2-oxo acid dehydrogenase subunit E2 [Dehalococcoidia bacterium]|nr:2-oxo acid dehydrogenase subunit E2 [Dehalococcoidia bacterium]MCA9831841.1 2-oxo acid dehydrogenase subunit E2 [Dehalococcoidia bacterium]MCB9484466.1 2-oxo acid dehydrogenase subunit E2 [Thermoflexaceae bacterium]